MSNKVKNRELDSKAIYILSLEGVNPVRSPSNGYAPVVMQVEVVVCHQSIGAIGLYFSRPS